MDVGCGSAQRVDDGVVCVGGSKGRDGRNCRKRRRVARKGRGSWQEVAYQRSNAIATTLGGNVGWLPI